MLICITHFDIFTYNTLLGWAIKYCEAQARVRQGQARDGER